MVGPTQAQTPLKVIVFPGLSNFSIFAAQHKGLFAKHGLTIELINTPTSNAMREGVAKGEYQIAHAGVDNAVAMVDATRMDRLLVRVLVVLVLPGAAGASADTLTR